MAKKLYLHIKWDETREKNCSRAGDHGIYDVEINEGDEVELKAGGLRYVGRGGLKMEGAINAFGLEVGGMTCVDIGASTGGFTDCLLQNGAKKVYAVDCGSGQLHSSLLKNERVVNIERTNVRYLTENEVPDKLDFVSIDVSFISLTKVLPVAYNLTSENGEVVCLIKVLLPTFWL